MNDQVTPTTERVTSNYHFRTKDGYKRPSVEVEYDAPTAGGIIEILQAGDKKVVDLITETVQGIMTSHIKGYVDEDTEFDQAKLEELVAEGKVSLEHIASIPKADRNVMSKEDLEQFAKDYIAIMPGLTNKDEARVKAAATLFVERFKRAAGDEAVLAILQEQLAIFVEGAPEEIAQRNDKVLNWAVAKLDELLSVKITADAL